MSEYNRNVSSNSKPQTVPGTPLQQMWHILNFHEERFNQMEKYLSMQNSNTGGINKKSETQHLEEYNLLVSQVESLKTRLSTLEAKMEKGEFPSNVTLSIEEQN